MIALDLDGTIISQDRTSDAINWQIIDALRSRGVLAVAICTNQGGLPFRVMGSDRYPTAADFGRRLALAARAIRSRGMYVTRVRVCTYHPKATDAAIQRAARDCRAVLAALGCADWHVYTTDQARKPNGLMLVSVGAAEFWGDSADDQGAAAAAGVPFVAVQRF